MVQQSDTNKMSRRFFILSGLGLGIVGLKHYVAGGQNTYTPKVHGKIYIVTGGTSGIGKETVKELMRLDGTVIVTGRDLEKATNMINDSIVDHKSKNRAMPQFHFEQVDFSDLEDVRKFARKFSLTYNRLDGLVNNAGQYNSKVKYSKQGVEMTMAVNHLAPAYLTHLLLPMLEKTDESRVINVSSMAHALKQPDVADFFLQRYHADKYDAFACYAQSKLANVLFTKGLKNYLEKKQSTVKTASLHPGAVATELFRDIPYIGPYVTKIFYPFMWLAMKTEKEGSQTTLTTLLIPHHQLRNGAYYKDCQVAEVAPFASDPANIDAAWNATVAKLKEATGDKVIFGQ